MVKIQAFEKSSHATLRDPLKLPLTKQTIEMLPPVLHAVIYCQKAPSAAWQGATASPKLLPPAPRTAGTRPTLLPGLAMLPPPLWEDENSSTSHLSFISLRSASAIRHGQCLSQPGCAPPRWGPRGPQHSRPGGWPRVGPCLVALEPMQGWRFSLGTVSAAKRRAGGAGPSRLLVIQ